MAILGTFIDKQTISRAGDALGSVGAGGVTTTTLNHSLPATTPELFLPVLKSMQAVSIGQHVLPLAVGANQSLLTIGFHSNSTASTPTILLDVFAAVFYSMIR